MGKTGAYCAMMVGITFIGVGVFFFGDPVRDTVQDPTKFWPALAESSIFTQLRFWSYGLGALFALGAVPAISSLVEAENPGLVRWMTNLAYLSFAVTAVDNFHLLPVLPKMAEMYVAGDPSVQSFVADSRSWLLLDPQTWLKFGALGAWVLVVSRLGQRSGTLKTPLVIVGYGLAVLSILTIVGISFRIKPLIMLGAGLGGIVMLPIWFIGMGRRLLQDSPENEQ